MSSSPHINNLPPDPSSNHFFLKGSGLLAQERLPESMSHYTAQQRSDVYEALIKDPRQTHGVFNAVTVPLFADDKGDSYSLFDEGYKRYLQEEHLDKFNLLNRNLRLLQQLIEGDDSNFNKPGQALKYLYDVAISPPSNPEKNKAIQRLNKKMYAKVQNIIHSPDVVSQENLSYEGKVEVMKQLCKQADKTYEDYMKMAYGENAEMFFSLTNEVKEENNPAKLILMVVNDNLSARMRFEAYRKLLLANEMVRISHDSGDSEFNNYYNRNLDESGFFVTEENSESPKLTTVYLVSTHPDPKTRTCTEAYFSTSRPTTIDDGMKVSELKMRAIKNNEGEERYLFMSTRKKSDLSILIKAMRKGNARYDNLSDLHGSLFVMQNTDDLRALEGGLHNAFSSQGCDYVITESEDGTKGKSFRKFTAGQSNQFKNISSIVQMGFPQKLDTEGVAYQDHLRETVEHQKMTADMWAEAKYSLGSAHSLYEVRRIHESGIPALLNPPEIYGYCPIEEQLAKEAEVVEGLGWGSESVKQYSEDFLNKKAKALSNNPQKNGQLEAIYKLAKKRGVNLNLESCVAMGPANDDEFDEVKVALDKALGASKEAMVHFSKAMRGLLKAVFKKF